MRSGGMFSLLLCLATPVFGAGPVPGPADHPSIKLVLDGKPSDTFDREALALMPRTSVQAATNGGPPSTWQGVALEDIVRRTCVASGDALSGRAIARLVRVTAANGYQVVFSATELDPDFGNVEVLLADTRDGKPLAQDGPFRLIVPRDKRTDRWVDHVTTIEVVDASTP
ncbi:molybdopterin-dependent oxidoreductase [Dyella sp. EPa41]|uniref:molybdopterin-dependent oxidoreductase n=1 Tax=Dyella sp. EPa41 TaxID=1561194 RepID=UPI0019158142|nr:molybdopterin-dependent oxidoreductase [Dyella sp. EPa41]